METVGPLFRLAAGLSAVDRHIGIVPTLQAVVSLIDLALTVAEHVNLDVGAGDAKLVDNKPPRPPHPCEVTAYIVERRRLVPSETRICKKFGWQPNYCETSMSKRIPAEV